MLTWVSVTTVHAPVWLIKLHANYMINLGAQRVVYFLDCPEFYSIEDIESISALATVILCDSAYWEMHSERPPRVPGRQLKNIAFARSKINAEWFFHIDIDEFPFVPDGVNGLIASIAPDVSEIRFDNVERVLRQDLSSWHEGILRLPNTDLVTQRTAYGGAAVFFGNGLVEYYHGKSMVKNKPNLIQSAHGSSNINHGFDVIRYNPPISAASIIHVSCMSRVHFFHRVKSKSQSSGRAGEKSYKLRHQYTLENWLFRNNQLQKNALQAFNLLYTCTRAQMEDWVKMELCAHMPVQFTRAIERAASGSEELQLAYVDSTFAEFYSRR